MCPSQGRVADAEAACTKAGNFSRLLEGKLSAMEPKLAAAEARAGAAEAR